MLNRFGIELTTDDLPMWRWARLATPEFFNRIPEIPLENLPPEPGLMADAIEESKAAEEEPKKEKQIFYYAEVKAQYCIDDELDFCGALAKAHFRMQKEKDEKIFLRGNVFLAKLAKAALEKNSDSFVKACEKYADEEYFNECAKSLGKLDFAVENNGKPNKDSWLGLYKMVLLLTEEYLATKCELAKLESIECKDNSESAEELEIILASQDSIEEDLDSAALHPIKGKHGFYNSSDNIKIGDLFYEFLSDSFPGKASEEEFTLFMRSIYGDEVCEDLGWLYKKLERNSLPRPNFNIDAMENEDILGMHEGESITLKKRLVLDTISPENHEDGFAFFLTLLNQYGHFLNFVLHDEARKSMGDSKITGRLFTYKFIKNSGSDLFSSDFEYADILIPDAAMEGERKLALGVSGLSYEQRIDILHNLCMSKIWEG